MPIFESEGNARTTVRNWKAWRLAIGVASLLAVAAFLWWRGYFAGLICVGRSEAWRNITGSHECFPFRVENGKGFVYDGPNYDNPEMPVATRPDWTVSRLGRTYVLYDVDPANMEPSMFEDEFEESLWIGLVGDDGKIVRKIRLATGVKKISGIRYELGGGVAYVTATSVDGWKRIIPLRFPEPWPELKPTGDVWRDFEARMERLDDELWEEWPDNESGYAADWVSSRYDEAMMNEYRKAIEMLKASAPTDTRRAELDAELSMALAMTADDVEGSFAEAANVHWGNFYERVMFERAMEPYLRNWLEAAANPENWDTVRNAKGTLHGVEFAVTSGVAVITVPTSWVYKRWAEKDGEDPDAIDPNIDEGNPNKWKLLVRLSPARVLRNGDVVSTDYDIIAPDIMDSGYDVGQGTVEIFN